MWRLCWTASAENSHSPPVWSHPRPWWVGWGQGHWRDWTFPQGPGHWSGVHTAQSFISQTDIIHHHYSTTPRAQSFISQTDIIHQHYSTTHSLSFHRLTSFTTTIVQHTELHFTGWHHSPTLQYNTQSTVLHHHFHRLTSFTNTTVQHTQHSPSFHRLTSFTTTIAQHTHHSPSFQTDIIHQHYSTVLHFTDWHHSPTLQHNTYSTVLHFTDWHHSPLQHNPFLPNLTLPWWNHFFISWLHFATKMRPFLLKLDITTVKQPCIL